MLHQIKAIVEECLQEDNNARGSDWQLYKDVCKKMNIDISTITVEQMCDNHNKLNFPSFESVRRTRAKFQSEGQYLTDELVQHYRAEQEKLYRKEFA